MTEAQEQRQLIRWTSEPQSLLLHPELRLLYHVPNGGRRDAREARQLQLMGVKAGVPDLCLPVARGGRHGLYIELKTDSGRTSGAQDRWLEDLREQGYAACVCHGWADAARTLSLYLQDGG